MSEDATESLATHGNNMDTKKPKAAQKKALATRKKVMTLTKARLDKLGWKSVELKSKTGAPAKGIVDLMAIRLDGRDKDLVKVILFKVKVGKNNRVDDADKKRLEEAAYKLDVAVNWAEKPEKKIKFGWEPTKRGFDLHLIK